jgi:GT2 family glycosyltransferase
MLNIDTNLSISVLITCHNRKDKTLECLRLLFLQNGINNDFNIKVFLVDDGSTDGTSEAIANQFSEVRIIQGNGNLFWNRGMHLAWGVASKESNPDFYLWLNDDVELEANAILVLLNNSKINALEIINGPTYWGDEKYTTYSGYDENNHLLFPNGRKQICSYFNGNIVLVSKNVFKILGNLEYTYRHGLGDFDYCYRANKIAIKLYMAPQHLGKCEGNNKIKGFLDHSIPIIRRLQLLYHPLSGASPLEFWLLAFRKAGVLSALKYLISIHFKVLFPKLFGR